jgi:hypothetical protein
VRKSLDQNITEARIPLFHKFDIPLYMRAQNPQSNAEVGAKHILDQVPIHSNIERLHYVPIKPNARLLLVMLSITEVGLSR